MPFRSICTYIYIATLVHYDHQAKSLELADAIAIWLCIVYSDSKTFPCISLELNTLE